MVATGVGGGLVRDVLPGTNPPLVLVDLSYILVCIAAALLVFRSAPRRATSALFGRLRAGDAHHRGRVEFEPGRGNEFAAGATLAVGTIVDTRKRAGNAPEFNFAPGLRRLRHRLALQGIHARQAAHPRLVEFDRGGRVVGLGRDRFEFGAAGEKTAAVTFDVHARTIGRGADLRALPLGGQCP